jgi:hypothetical protein
MNVGSPKPWASKGWIFTLGTQVLAICLGEALEQLGTRPSGLSRGPVARNVRLLVKECRL